MSDDRQREFARDNSRIIQSMPGSWTSSNPERIGPIHLFHSYVDFTYSKIYGQICQTTDIETGRENVRLLSFNTVIVHTSISCVKRNRYHLSSLTTLEYGVNI